LAGIAEKQTGEQASWPSSGFSASGTPGEEISVTEMSKR